MKKFLICTLVMLFAAQSACAQDAADNKPKVTAAAAGGLATREETRAIAEACVQRMLSGDVAGAFGLLKPIFPIPENEIGMLEMQTIQQLGMVGQRFGNAVAYEFVDEKSVKDTFIQYRYIEKYDNHAIKWVFTFYKPKDRWYLNNIGWDDQINQLFE